MDPPQIMKHLEALNKWRQEHQLLLRNEHERQRVELTRELSFEEATDSSSKTKYLPVRKTSGYSTGGSFESDGPMNQQQACETKTTHRKQSHRFLRRGEGLKQRFKMAPDAFNLDKLPRYKYANAHPSLRKECKKTAKESTQKEKPCNMQESLRPASKTPPLIPPLDLQEHRFQRVLINSRSIVSSTPEAKPPSPGLRATNKANHNMQTAVSAKSAMELGPNSQCKELIPLHMAWSEVLDPLNIKPVPVAKLREVEQQTNHQQHSEEDDHLNLFELLEQRAKEGSFDADSSIIKRVLAAKSSRGQNNEDEFDIIPLTAKIREARITPSPTGIVALDTSAENSESEDEGDGEQTAVNENSDVDEDTLRKTTNLHVRFVEAEQTQENETSTMLHDEASSAAMYDSTVTDISSAEFCDQIQKIIFAALAKHDKSKSNLPEVSTTSLSAAEMKNLAEQTRARVAELERETALFKETNSKLLKEKQQHELDKITFLQYKEEVEEQINDEKIKLEIQLHDERIKLADERHKFEETMRMQKAATAKNNRKEYTKLKEDIAALETKLRDKEQSHVASQSRLRSQLRCLEKEQKTLFAEIERLKMENARLEKVNLQLSRQQNMTMLHEINRNIVKLACSSQSNTTTTSRSTTTNYLADGSSANVNSATSTTVPTKPAVKKPEKKPESCKSLKITTNSFTNLMQPQTPSNTKATNTSDDDDDDAVHESPKATAATTTEAEAAEVVTPKSTASSFKALSREIIGEDGSKEILYPNGTLRKDSGDGLTVRMMYFNGDIRETSVKEGTIKYYYAKTNTWHTTYLDGYEIIEFPNGQVEHRRPDGSIEVHFPHNNSVKIIYTKDLEKSAEWRFQDGSTLLEMRNGDKMLTLANGQKELHTQGFRQREYPDGTVKKVFPDGSYETRYSNGRLRLKDKDGNLIIDTEMQGRDGNGAVAHSS